MKTFLPYLMIMLLIAACASSCSKDNLADETSQRPDLTVPSTSVSKASIDVINQSERKQDVIAQVFLYQGLSLGNNFPVSWNKKIELSTSSVGKGRLHVIVIAEGHGSISVTDCDDNHQCNNISKAGQTQLVFDNVNLQDYKRVQVIYRSAACH